VASVDEVMRLRIIWTGKTRDARLRALIDDYAERLSHFVRCEVTELRELGRSDKTGIDKETKAHLRPSPARLFNSAAGC
jgi:23S rRNA pseudoU1915 N3-methylase RlmH